MTVVNNCDVEGKWHIIQVERNKNIAFEAVFNQKSEKLFVYLNTDHFNFM